MRVLLPSIIFSLLFGVIPNLSKISDEENDLVMKERDK